MQPINTLLTIPGVNPIARIMPQADTSQINPAWVSSIQRSASDTQHIVSTWLIMPLPLGEPAEVIDMVGWARQKGHGEQVPDTNLCVRLEHMNAGSIVGDPSQRTQAPLPPAAPVGDQHAS